MKGKKRSRLGVLVLTAILLTAFFSMMAWAGIASSPLGVHGGKPLAGLGSCPLGSSVDFLR